MKPSPQTSSTEALRAHEVETETIRAVDHEIKPGVEADMGEGDELPRILERLLAS
jgi:hypothetical protein